jgi:hypothetical protein
MSIWHELLGYLKGSFRAKPILGFSINFQLNQAKGVAKQRVVTGSSVSDDVAVQLNPEQKTIACMTGK